MQVILARHRRNGQLYAIKIVKKVGAPGIVFGGIVFGGISAVLTRPVRGAPWVARWVRAAGMGDNAAGAGAHAWRA